MEAARFVPGLKAGASTRTGAQKNTLSGEVDQGAFRDRPQPSTSAVAEVAPAD